MTYCYASAFCCYCLSFYFTTSRSLFLFFSLSLCFCVHVYGEQERGVMGNAFFRWEACEADAAVDTLTFLAEDPNAPRFRLKHAAVGTALDSHSTGFCFYSRYVFLEVFTALQVLLAFFTLYLFNYMGTIRHYYAPRTVLKEEEGFFFPPKEKEVLVPHKREALAAVYLAVVVIGLCFILLVAAYILLTNSGWWASLETKRWEHDKQAAVSSQPSHGELQHRVRSSGYHLRRLGIRWISWTRPYYAFPRRYLPDFDYRHELHAKFGAPSTRGDPKKMYFVFLSPFVFMLTVMDIMTVDEMRVTEMRVSLLQGLLLACGPLFLFYVASILFMSMMMSQRSCFGDTMGVLYA
ncbi:hypothetical protein Tc00.1047053508909.80 [Trypanosoma cruzi]|uniref:Uncharacterized protein n=1 Tax=Trypanosoma cruzi (strain CL Brener) TaxID=353153 RepID=Q4E1L6_TRYCC|nr:hypothetical protein Tc00.1047053508909.80 [Trypanosoma cruzi]EAN98656.1 hypothetical protein Tc00.1047053508909.80 [Trypanosoma cruzi]|eukprot:XP_820507.1 hypothetical protein [Trypanosoma cruzi strain CL Brener]